MLSFDISIGVCSPESDSSANISSVSAHELLSTQRTHSLCKSESLIGFVLWTFDLNWGGGEAFGLVSAPSRVQ